MAIKVIAQRREVKFAFLTAITTTSCLGCGPMYL